LCAFVAFVLFYFLFLCIYLF